MAASRRLVASVVVSTLVTWSGGCTTTKSIGPLGALGHPPFADVKPGQKVEVRTRDGRRAHVSVKAIIDDTLVGTDGKQHALADIVTVRRTSFSSGKTGALIAASVVGLHLIKKIGSGVLQW